ncbi:MAG TPA: helix-turn-helix transcriptional regulator [Rectinemataceae bacterium]|nr:helix-turn-helix transcriptional regulator [Rectinemataceae bacterium]
MSAPIDVQIIRAADGSPAFAVLPYAEYEQLAGSGAKPSIPHEVVGKMIDGKTAARAWREHLGLTQSEVAARMDITQAAYSQLESSEKLRPTSRRRLAEALGLVAEQLVQI